MSAKEDIFKRLLAVRKLNSPARAKAFLKPDYQKLADPYLLPDMRSAVDRIKQAHTKKEKIVIYGDYDIDGLSATALLKDGLEAFGLMVKTFIPSRFEEGYGLSGVAIKKLASEGASLIITVDCGSLSYDEIELATTLGVDMIITDHHNVDDNLPRAVAVINPKRTDHNYPFTDFSGVGVAFQLVRALQAEFNKHPSTSSGFPGLAPGQEKWLLDLVALGTICDIVSLTGENRTLAYWGLKVLSRCRRPGIKALLAVIDVKPADVTARTLGFMIGPRLNAAGRLETAQRSLDILTTQNPTQAFSLAQELDAMNKERRRAQDMIFKEATIKAKTFEKDSVLIVSHPDWNHGIVGIVASKMVEKFHKPAFVLQEMGSQTKGSARSFGDFSLSKAITATQQLLIKGGGHDAAAGVTLNTSKVPAFRKAVNKYYQALKLANQKDFLLPKADLSLNNFDGVNEALVDQIALLEPFGHGNPTPILEFKNMKIVATRIMGTDNQHIKLTLQDTKNQTLQFLSFSAPKHFFVETGEQVSVWATLTINQWNGNRTVEGRLLEIKPLDLT